MHYYQFNISDWVLHTSHLKLEEEAVYRRLIDHYYDTEQPIPEDYKQTIRRLRMSEYSTIVDDILHEFFELTCYGWAHSRCDKEIDAYQRKADSARANGKKGGRPKKEKEPNKTQPVNLANPEITGSKANYELLTTNQELETNNKSKDIVANAKSDCPHDKIINLYHEKLPMLPKVKIWSDKRKAVLRTRWRESEKHQSLEFWEGYFDHVSNSLFLTGRAGGERPFTPSLEWLINSSNFVKVIEGNYQ